jgi:hypothetical protein
MIDVRYDVGIMAFPGKPFGNALRWRFCCTDTNEKQAGELACKVLGWNGNGREFCFRSRGRKKTNLSVFDSM